MTTFFAAAFLHVGSSLCAGTRAFTRYANVRLAFSAEYAFLFSSHGPQRMVLGRFDRTCLYFLHNHCESSSTNAAVSTKLLIRHSWELLGRTESSRLDGRLSKSYYDRDVLRGASQRDL